MRWSTCLSRTSCAGGCTFCCLSCCKTIRLASSRSYWVMASSLTTATTRSTLTTPCGGALGCASAQADASANPTLKKFRNAMGDLLELWKIIARSGAAGPQGRVGDGHIAGHAALQDIDRVGAEARESVQLELHEHGLAGLLRRRRQPLTHDAKRPAPTIVLEARDALQGLAVDQRIVPAPDRRPAVQERPLPGEIDLCQLRRISSRIDLLAYETVARIEHPTRPRLPAHAEVETLGLRMIEVVF